MKYHFWVLTVLVVAIGVTGWFFASNGLADQFAADKGRLNSSFNTARTIQNEQDHPNDTMSTDVRNQTEQLAESIRQAWEELYERQRDEVLKWPEGLPQTVLAAIEGKKFPDELPDKQVDLYQNFLRGDYLNKLPQLAEAQDVNAPLETYKVVWQDQAVIRAKFDWATRQTSSTIWLAQEDLWILENLLTIIQRTNADATGPHDAPVKQITALEIGNEVTQAATARIWAPALAGAGGGGARGGRGGRGGRGAGGGVVGGRGGRGGAADNPDLSVAMLEGRYIDAAGQPIPPDQLASIVEYKRLPVRMTLKMDQRELPRLLVECANAALRVEVTEVRINAAAGKGRAAPVARGRGRAGQRGRGRAPAGRGRAPAAVPLAGIVSAEDPNLADVIVQGIVYLYNPPDLAILGIPEPAPAAAESEQSPVALLDDTDTQ